MRTRSRLLTTAIAAWALALCAPAGQAQSEPATPAPAQTPATAPAPASAGVINRPKAPRPTTDTPREGCVSAECHTAVKEHKILHGPVHANACDSCHKLNDPASHTFEPTRSRSEMCILCHTVTAPEGDSIHKPFAEGECLSCHDPHGSNEPAILRGDRYADSCKSCHTDVTGAHDHVHGPVAAGACGACHQPHASKYPKLLNSPGRDLCLRCHLSVGIQIESRSVVHKPVLGDCGVCHEPHANDRSSLLVSDPVALCTSCHENIAKEMEGATSQHAAVTTKRSCLNCHSPHASDRANLLKEEEKSLCLECHNTAIKLEDGTKLLNMKEVLEHGKSLHGVIADRSCSICHQIHGGGHRRLLTNEYPSDLYYPFSESTYALCFSCHDRQLVSLDRTDGATGFRNGDENLHFVHVNRKDKGRSCRVCHDAHAVDSEQHIRKDFPFGPKGWKLPIRYEQLPDGGKCGAGCHQAMEYSRTKPLVYPPHVEGGNWNGAELVPGAKANPPADKPPDPSPAPANPSPKKTKPAPKP